jgi:predicted NBD/HSP70 family sugar kinase
MEKLNNNSIVLCGRRGCCPTLTLNENIVKIKDDYGNEIKITKEQALSVGLAIKELEK